VLALLSATLIADDMFCTLLFVMFAGRVPKIHLLRPEFVIVITYELILLMFKRLFGRGVKPPPKQD